MAFSLLGLAAVAGIAAAQYPPQPTSYPVYNSTISPWPTAPQTPAASGWGAATTTYAPSLPSFAPSRTMYYKKEVGAGVVPASNNAAFPPPLVAPAPKDEMRVPPPVLFRLEAEAILHKRIKVEKKDDKLEFPPQPVEDKPYAQRTFAPMAVEAEPNFVCYGRLLFEEKNTERYGWDLGPIAPLLLAANFYKDYAALPYKVFSFPRLRYDCSAGLPLPGEPVPLLVYPPGLSVTGGLAEAGAIVALRAIIPRP